VKEEILDKESKTNLMQKCVHEAYKRGYDMGVLQATNKINHNTKEVDLEQEIQQHINNCLDIKFPTTDIKMIAKDVEYTARMFFELGFKAQKGE
jgi:hypothetical protein